MLHKVFISNSCVMLANLAYTKSFKINNNNNIDNNNNTCKFNFLGKSKLPNEKS